MKLCLISDTHGHLPTIPTCDIFIHAGDLCPTTNHSFNFQESWINTNFTQWLKSIDAKYKVFIPGNHDFWFEFKLYQPKTDNIWCLLDQSIIIDNYKIWGTPWQNWFLNWAFNAPKYDPDEKFLHEKYQKIPIDTDIIISHGPPYQHGDFTLKENVGSKALLKCIKHIKPKLVVTGHIHSARGIYTIDHGQSLTHVINAAYLCNNYKPQKAKIIEWQL